MHCISEMAQAHGSAARLRARMTRKALPLWNEKSAGKRLMAFPPEKFHQEVITELILNTNCDARDCDPDPRSGCPAKRRD